MTLIASFIAMVAFVSCVRKDAGTSDTAVAVADSTSAEDSEPDDVEMLSSKWKGIPVATKEFDDYIAAQIFNTTSPGQDTTVAEIEYSCKPMDTVCNNTKKKTVHFRVVPRQGGHNLNWESALKPHKHGGYILAKYLNLDGIEVPSLKLAANTPMYQWVGNITKDTSAIEVFSISGGSVQVASRIQEYQHCKDKQNEGKNRKVSAAKHQPHHESDPAWECKSEQAEKPYFPTPAGDRYPDDLWLSCKAGCCQASPTRSK
jgi:hypothetical protein